MDLRNSMISSPLTLPLGRIHVSLLLPIAASLLVVGCSPSREDVSSGSDAAPASEMVSPQSNGGASLEARAPSDAPLTASEEGDIRRQVESNWNMADWGGSPEVAGMVVELRISLLPDGTITDVKLLNDRPGDTTFRQVADSAIRAVKISSPLNLPPGREYSAMILRFRPDWEHP